MNSLLSDAIETLEQSYERERDALKRFIKQPIGSNSFFYYSMLAMYLSARKDADVLRSMIDEDILNVSTSECLECNFEVDTLEKWKATYAVPFEKGYSKNE